MVEGPTGSSAEQNINHVVIFAAMVPEILSIFYSVESILSKKSPKQPKIPEIG